MTKVRLCFHDRCFDGTASAALFYRFYRERFAQSAEFGFTGMTHRAAQPWEDGLFDGDENVIVDFKYSNSPKVTWWFDHHQSAFLTPADAEHFRQHPGPQMFYEPDYKSCTMLIADVTRTKFGFDTVPLAELIRWGDIIDAYLTLRPSLLLLLVDARRGLNAEDQRIVDWALHHKKPLRLLFTKTDKLTKNQKAQLGQDTSLPFLSYSIKDPKARKALLHLLKTG